MEEVKVLVKWEKEPQKPHTVIYRFKNKRVIIQKNGDGYRVITRHLIKHDKVGKLLRGNCVLRFGVVLWETKMTLSKETIDAIYRSTEKFEIE